MNICYIIWWLLFGNVISFIKGYKNCIRWYEAVILFLYGMLLGISSGAMFGIIYMATKEGVNIFLGMEMPHPFWGSIIFFVIVGIIVAAEEIIGGE